MIGPFNLEELVDLTTDTFFDRAVEKGLSLSVYICPDVQSSYLGDAEALRRALILLLENAFAHTSKGVIQVAVEPDPEEPGLGAVLIRVSDTGEGIPLEQQQRLNAFFTGDDASLPEGSGLARVKRQVARLGGSLGVRGEPGKGAIFWFTTRFAAKPCGGHCKSGDDHDHDHDHDH
jgi:signal transduction histidine kinase